MNSYMNSYMNKVCVYNGVYEGNIPVSMIHLYTRGLRTYTRGEAHLSLFKSYANKIFTRGLGLIPTWRPMVFLGRFKENLHFCFDLLFKVKKQIDRYMYKNVYVQKGVQ